MVAGTDLSKTARIATERAAALAGSVSAELVLVHAGPGSEGPLEELAESLGASVMVSKASVMVSKGNPVDVLLEAAEAGDSTLLVVGSVGMRGPVVSCWATFQTR